MSETDTSFPVPDWAADDDETSDATPTAVADEPAVGDEPAAQPEPASEPVPKSRDVTGRFAKTSVTPQAPLGAPASGTPPQTLASPEPPAPPPDFTYKADGREYKIPGLIVPEAMAEQVRQLLSEGMHHRTTWRQQQQAVQEQVRQAEAKLATDRANVDYLSKTLTEAFQDPEKLAQMYADWQQQGPIYLERAKHAALQAELESYRNQETQSFQQRAEEAKTEHLWESIQRVAGEKFPGAFDESTMAAAYGELAPLGLIQVADKDYPEYGYKRGDIVLDEAALYGHLARHAQTAQAAKNAQELAAQKVAKVAAKNAAVMGQGARAPATVSARTGQVPAGKTPPPTTAKDWRNWVDTDDE